MSTQTVWSYSERILTGYAIAVIGLTAITLGYIFANFLAHGLGVFALALGAARIYYARGIRDMLNLNRDDDDQVADFDLTLDAEDER